MVISSTLVAFALAVALVLRPSRITEPRLPVAGHIPPDVREALQGRMAHHGAQMTELLLALIVLDQDAAARMAGALYDEPSVDPGLAGGRVAPFLPPQFFALQEQLKQQARLVVTAAAEQDTDRLTDSFAALTKTCVGCHALYLREQPPR